MKTFVWTMTSLVVLLALLIGGLQYSHYRQAHSAEGVAAAERDAAALAKWEASRKK